SRAVGAGPHGRDVVRVERVSGRVDDDRLETDRGQWLDRGPREGRRDRGRLPGLRPDHRNGRGRQWRQVVAAVALLGLPGQRGRAVIRERDVDVDRVAELDGPLDRRRVDQGSRGRERGVVGDVVAVGQVEVTGLGYIV